MTNQELNDLLARFEGSSLSKLKLSTQEFTIEMERAVSAPAAPVIVKNTRRDVQKFPSPPKNNRTSTGKFLVKSGLFTVSTELSTFIMSTQNHAKNALFLSHSTSCNVRAGVLP